MWFTQSFQSYFFTGILTGLILLILLWILQNLYLSSTIEDISKFSRILIITDYAQCEEACKLLRSHCQNLSALGFDCEWNMVKGFQRPVALLQLASAEGLCCLFRLNVISEIPHSLKELLTDENIIKLGVSPNTDSKHLIRDYSVQVRGVLDLRHLYDTHRGLAWLASNVIGIQLDKSYKVKCSDWESIELSQAQKDYAAKDALVAIEIFKAWLLKNKKTNFWFREMKLIFCQLAFEDNKKILSRFLDIPYNAKQQITNNVMPESAYVNQSKIKNIYWSRKSPLYHNCFMHAPDGELLCSCDKRKALWYVEKGLAEVLPGEPYSIRLLFEPNGRADNSNGRFYQQLKQNHCVVCGSSEFYLKHYVVPKEYRKHFPTALKEHKSHDIVLMCVKCHLLATQHNEVLKQKLATLCNAPVSSKKEFLNKNAQKIKNYAKALLNSDTTIPPERKEFLENEIRQFYSVDNLNEDLLKKAALIETTTVNENYEIHGLKVVNYFNNQENGLINFEKLWRTHFVDTMKPQYLPAYWSVTHNHFVTNEKTSSDN